MCRGMMFPIVGLLLASLAAGFAGPLVSVRRATYAAGAISHGVFGGIGLAVFLAAKCGYTFLTPMMGALGAALISSIILAEVATRRLTRPDTILSCIWAGGFSLGMLFMVLATGAEGDMEEFLLGSVLTVDGARLGAMGALDCVGLGLLILGYNRFLAIAFDSELALLRGLNVRVWEYAFHLLLAFTVVGLVVVAGVVLAVAFLALPAMSAAALSDRLSTRMVLAGVIAFCASLAGLFVSQMCGVPIAAAITLILIGVKLCLIKSLLQRLTNRKRRAIAHA